ncbi:MAG: ABC transporter ATP-binding protein [Christensenellaceae bacterium]|jgi:oligopeptide transport system ATP-binding protein|nr:ABC transporter ATP-binding protein [Christensenellaceae bacterium]
MSDQKRADSAQNELFLAENALLSVRNLTVRFKTGYGVVGAVRGVDFDLKKGKTLAIVGESGSGKSVTVKALAGLLGENAAIESGSAVLRGPNGEKTDLFSLKRREMRRQINGRRIAMVFQDPMTSLDPTMPIGKQLMEGLRDHLHLGREKATEEAVRLLKLVEIPEAESRMRSYPHQLSGGMRQRVVIAMALSCNPEILICDEPTTALDVTIQSRILELIQDLQRKLGLSVIYITHDLGVVAKVADEIAVMYAGRIVERGLADEIFYDPRHPYTWGLLLAMPDVEMDSGELYTIPGNPPNMVGQTVGEPFAPRNEYALNIDFRREAPMFKLSETHYAATWLLHEKAPEVARPARFGRPPKRLN